MKNEEIVKQFLALGELIELGLVVGACFVVGLAIFFKYQNWKEAKDDTK
jgi:hypothetical protein